MSSSLVRPTHVRRLDVRCTAMDAVVESLAVPVVFFFERRLDARALARTLADALSDAPLFAARMTETQGAMHIRCEGQGVPFTVVSSDRTLADAMQSTVEDRGRWLVDMVRPGRARRGQDPLLTVRVTHLADGATALGCCWHHSVGDLHSFMLLIRAWVASASGETVAPSLTVEDRVGYLDQHLAPDGATEPGVRRLGFGEILRYVLYFATEARKKRALAFYFGEQEIERMRDAFSVDARLTANDVLCAHLSQLVAENDHAVDQRSLAISVNIRRRCGLDEALMGNMVGALRVDVGRTDSASTIARRLRSELNSFARTHSDTRITQQFVDRLPRGHAKRCVYKAIDPIRRNLVISNWSKFGVYDVRFESETPVYFTPVVEVPIPWLGAIVEGSRGRGSLVSVALPHQVADILSTPGMRERIHQFRRASDDVPELHRYAAA